MLRINRKTIVVAVVPSNGAFGCWLHNFLETWLCRWCSVPVTSKRAGTHLTNLRRITGWVNPPGVISMVWQGLNSRPSDLKPTTLTVKPTTGFVKPWISQLQSTCGTRPPSTHAREGVFGMRSGLAKSEQSWNQAMETTARGERNKALYFIYTVYTSGVCLHIVSNNEPCFPIVSGRSLAFVFFIYLFSFIYFFIYRRFLTVLWFFLVLALKVRQHRNFIFLRHLEGTKH